MRIQNNPHPTPPTPQRNRPAGAGRHNVVSPLGHITNQGSKEYFKSTILDPKLGGEVDEIA